MLRWIYIVPLLSLMLALAPPVQAQETLENLRFEVTAFEILGDNPIGAAGYKALQPFVGEHFGLEGLSAAADALEQAVIKAGYSFHRVSLPPQQLTSGKVQLKISRFAIGKIAVQGNQYFNRDNILNSIPVLVSGSTPNMQALSRSVKLANEHAAKNVVLQFNEGEAPDTIDANLTVEDKSPQLLFVTLDNTGSEQAEEYRTTLGYQHGNLFNRDHAMTATFTTAPEDPDTTTQIGLNYRIPLYAQGASIDLLLSDSEVNSGTVGSSIVVSGKGSVVGLIYNKSLLSAGSFTHYWSIGMQHKLFENQYSVATISNNADVLSVPLELGYSFTHQGPGSSLSGGIRLAANFSSGNNGEEADYDAVRPGADNGWSASRFNLAYDRVLGEEWLVHFGISGQISDDLLIPGEQFGVGGVGSLRGFQERSITGDFGQQVNLEFWMPALTSYQLRVLFFYDLASVEFNDDEKFDLSSAGLGLRWSWKDAFNISLDYGQIIKGGGPDTNINQDGDDKFHLNLVYRF